MKCLTVSIWANI